MVELHPEQIPPPGGAVESNSLGLAAFILSIVGLFTAGTLSLVGLILGIVALRREPKGFAIAGIIIGLIGLLGGCIFLSIMMGLIGAGALGIGLLSMFSVQIDKGTTELDRASQTIIEWHTTHSGLPDEAEGEALLKARGIDADYELLPDGHFEITLEVLDSSGDPWTFTGTYGEDGHSHRIKWTNDGETTSISHSN